MEKSKQWIRTSTSQLVQKQFIDMWPNQKIPKGIKTKRINKNSDWEILNWKNGYRMLFIFK